MTNAPLPVKIGLMGPFGFGNLGDAAIQQAMIQHIRLYRPDAHIYGFSLNPQDTEQRHGIPSYRIAPGSENSNGWLARLPHKVRYHPLFNGLVRIFVKLPAELIFTLRSWRILKGFDLLIVSGGGQLDDYWGGTWQQPLTLFRWAVLAKLSKTRFWVVSVGAERLATSLSRFFVRRCLALADYRSYRDEKSKQFVQSIGFNSQDDPVYSDLAYSLRVAQRQAPVLPNGSGPIVAIGPMAYCHPRVWPRHDEAAYRDYLTKLADLVLWLIERGYRVLFFANQSVHDRWAIQDLREILNGYGNANWQDTLLEPDIQTVDDLMAQLARAEIVVASRLHGMLLSHVLHKPVLAIAYNRKINVVMDDLGQGEYCLDIDHLDADALKAKFAALEANRDAAAAHIAACVQFYRCALEEQYERLFKKV